MSRAFVKEPDGGQVPDDQPDRPQSPHPNYFTPAGLAALQARVRELEATVQRLAGRRDDLEAQQRLRPASRDLRYWQERLTRAILVDPATQPAGRVAFGATVTVVDAGGAERAYTIVGEDEADPAAGRISWVSPLARALLGAAVDDEVTWQRPAGDLVLEVQAIRYGDGGTE